MSVVPTLLQPYGYSSSTCGYCSPSGQRSVGPSSKSYGMVVPQMSTAFYQNLIDRGWRRSGTYVYHPDMARTCCPQYTIRLDALAFKPDKKQRQVLNRFNRFLTTGCRPGDSEPQAARASLPASESASSTTPATGTLQSPQGSSKGKGKGKGKGAEFDFLEQLGTYRHASARRFTVELTPAKSTPETFELYKKYQIAVHKDAPEKVTSSGFKRFLCDSPLIGRPIRYTGPADGLPQTEGSYHLHGRLIGVSVVDVLPATVSSVYFFWDPDWAWATLGKLSALHEAGLSVRMRRAGASAMQWLHMGFWIANCTKMRYKSEYSPSELLDPATLRYHALTPALDRCLQAFPRGYRPFAELEAMSQADVNALKPATSSSADKMDTDVTGDSDSDDVEQDEAYPSPPPPGMADPGEIDAGDVLVYTSVRRKPVLLPLKEYGAFLTVAGRRMASELVAAVGIGLMATGDGEIADRGLLHFG